MYNNEMLNTKKELTIEDTTIIMSLNMVKILKDMFVYCQTH